GLTFERALRAALRQDPNVLMIGEIRDAETARIAIQAGMTGHLVISTLHAGRVARVFTRLLSIGLEPYLIASALSGAVAQRLARLLCPDCRVPDKTAGGRTAAGCEKCGHTGYRGRVGIFEIAVVNEPLRELILSRAIPEKIAHEVERLQTCNLVESGRRLVETGEISRVEFEFLLSGED
ncbi:MAG: ATPase, T2SS/T4P/T4SS family, partial [bacterium]